MLPHNIICKIGSYLSLSSILNLFLVKFSFKVNCELFWKLQLEVNDICVKKHIKSKKIAKSRLENYYLDVMFYKQIFIAPDSMCYCKSYSSCRKMKYFVSFDLNFKSIDFTYNDTIREVHNIYSNTLQLFTFSNARLEKISKLNAPNLKHMYLVSNCLVSIKKINTPKLEHLDLSNNKLVEFKCYLPSLKSLNLRNNFITELNLNQFGFSENYEYTNNSEYLTIYNKKTTIYCDIFVCLKVK
jgi:Leucine-rich repeat (LRR) protein